MNKKPHKKEVQEFYVQRACTLLDFLFETHKGQSNNSIKSLLKNKHVSVGGAPITQFDFKLFKGDVVYISKFPIKKAIRNNLPIIYEDKDIVVINKPTKLLSIATDKEKKTTAYRIMMDYEQAKDKHNRVFVVHRLDEDTSGVLVFAKNQTIQKLLQDNWNNLVKKRGYFAIVDGVMDEKEKTISSYLKKNSQNLMYSSKDHKDAQFAVTHYKVIKENANYSLLDVNIDSGRKNQIRVHLGDLGHHVIGDDKYGKPTNPIKRLGLHAYELSFVHPVSKKLMTFKAPMPDIFNTLFK